MFYMVQCLVEKTEHVAVIQRIDNLFAVLHYDRGEIGVFEYPTIDTEQMAEGEIMIKPFTVSTSWDAPLMNLTQMAEDASKN